MSDEPSSPLQKKPKLDDDADADPKKREMADDEIKSDDGDTKSMEEESEYDGESDDDDDDDDDRDLSIDRTGERFEWEDDKLEYENGEFKEQWIARRKQMINSGGFDVDIVPEDLLSGIVPVIMENQFWPGIPNSELVKMLANVAIKKYNKRNDPKLEFVKMVNATVRPCTGCLYYLTFTAKEVSSPDEKAKVYQAKVQQFGSHFIRVHLFRLKPQTQALNSLWGNCDLLVASLLPPAEAAA